MPSAHDSDCAVPAPRVCCAYHSIVCTTGLGTAFSTTLRTKIPFVQRSSCPSMVLWLHRAIRPPNTTCGTGLDAPSLRSQEFQGGGLILILILILTLIAGVEGWCGHRQKCAEPTFGGSSMPRLGSGTRYEHDMYHLGHFDMRAMPYDCLTMILWRWSKQTFSLQVSLGNRPA